MNDDPFPGPPGQERDARIMRERLYVLARGIRERNYLHALALWIIGPGLQILREILADADRAEEQD